MSTKKKIAIAVGMLLLLAVFINIFIEEAALQDTLNDERAAARYTFSTNQLFRVMTYNQLQAKDYVGRIVTVHGQVAYIGQYKNAPEWYYVSLYTFDTSRIRCEIRDIYVNDLKKLSKDNYVRIKGRLLKRDIDGDVVLVNCVIVK
ncbi:MAG: hypothetical protein E6X17_03100 [Sporomusaceae bacterium]|nr:hypothetical protein [Sporomusaceae bacterium]